VALCDSIKESVQQRYQSGNWGEGVSPKLCYNIDYLVRLQKTVDYSDVSKIVEIGFGDWDMMKQIYINSKQYIGYELTDLFSKD
jgi:hypothetical protein